MNGIFLYQALLQEVSDSLDSAVTKAAEREKTIQSRKRETERKKRRTIELENELKRAETSLASLPKQI